MANRPIHVVESGGDSTGLKEFADGADSGVQLPSGTTAQRDSSASAGEVRFNSDTKKIEFYDGTKWNSSSFINVDNADYKGVFTIESTHYAKGATTGNKPYPGGTWFGFANHLNTATAMPFQQTVSNIIQSKFLPFGHANAHAGATEADLRFGPAGYNSLESEVTGRSTPILEIASNVPQSAMSDAYYNQNQHVGAIAFTMNSNDYNYYNYSGRWEGNRAFVSGITNSVEMNGIGYYGNSHGVNNLMTFWNSNYAGVAPFMSIGNEYENNQNNEIFFYPNGAKAFGTKIEIKPNDNLTSSTIKYEKVLTTGNIAVAAHSSGAQDISSNTFYYDDGSSNVIAFKVGQGNGGRIQELNLNFMTGKELKRIGMAAPSGTTLLDYTFIVRNNSSSNKTFIINPSNLDFFTVTNYNEAGFTGSWNHYVTDYTTANNRSGHSNIDFDSSFPSAGSQTTYTITPYGFILFKLLSYGASHAFFYDLKTDAI